MSVSLGLVPEKEYGVNTKLDPPVPGGKLRQYAHNTAESAGTQGV